MVSTYDDDTLTEAMEPVQNRIGRCAIAHRVTEKDDAIVPLAPNMAQDRLEGIPVGVDVGENQEAHGVSRRALHAMSATSSGDSDPVSSRWISARR